MVAVLLMVAEFIEISKSEILSPQRDQHELTGGWFLRLAGTI